MIWPPVKAWTSILEIDRKRHFVAINYGGDLDKKWIILMSVIDSSLIVNISWSQLAYSSQWLPGWHDVKNLDSSKLVSATNFKTIDVAYPSIDSGLTIPITLDNVRPWF
tara:strand:- start:8 stop:334 length:327 start_codon:yes stop_codon:yes gene_type:complete